MRPYILFIALLINGSLFAQSGTLSFKEKDIKLKDLKADNVPTVVSYTFENTGAQPVIITAINPITSQIKAEWDRTPIAPGKTSEIKVSFVSVNMPEKFSYSINISSNANPSRQQVTLTANIVDNPAKKELLYKYDMNGLKFKSGTLEFDNIFTNQIITDTFFFYNMQKAPVLMGVKYPLQHLTVNFVPTTVQPGQQGMMIVTFDAPKRNDFGYIYESLILSINNSNDYNNRLSITASIVEDFSKLTNSQRKNAPIAYFEKKEFDFGNLKAGDKANCDYTLTNKGKSDLFIRKTRASCGCTAIALGESKIAPGQTTTIRATFDSAGKTGRQYKSITVITNDPNTPEINLSLIGNVVNK